MLKYAKYISETQIQFPTAAEFPGIPNWQTHDAKLRDKNYVALEGIPEDRPGFSIVLDRFSFTPRKTTRREPRQVVVEDFDPETGEKTGEHTEMRDTDIEVDVSYITVLEHHYVPIPEPPPAVHTYSKLRLYDALVRAGIWEQVRAAIEAAGQMERWDLAVDLATDYAPFAAILRSMRQTYGDDTVDQILAEAEI